MLDLAFGYITPTVQGGTRQREGRDKGMNGVRWGATIKEDSGGQAGHGGSRASASAQPVGDIFSCF